jgi:hypothetical protein
MAESASAESGGLCVNDTYLSSGFWLALANDDNTRVYSFLLTEKLAWLRMAVVCWLRA